MTVCDHRSAQVYPPERAQTTLSPTTTMAEESVHWVPHQNLTAPILRDGKQQCHRPTR